MCRSDVFTLDLHIYILVAVFKSRECCSRLYMYCVGIRRGRHHIPVVVDHYVEAAMFGHLRDYIHLHRNMY